MVRKPKFEDPFHAEQRQRMKESRERRKGKPSRLSGLIDRPTYTRRLMYAIILTAILTATVTGVYVRAQSSVSIPYIMGGPYPGAPSYTLWTESSTFYAKDANGQIDFQGSNASAVIEDVLDVFTRGTPGASEANGGRLLIKEGNYTGLTGSFMVPDSTVIEGEGIFTKLALGAYNQPLFNVTGYNVKIRNLNLQGTKATGGSNAHGIAVHSTGTITGLWIENNIIVLFNQTGIYINGAGGSYQNTVFIVNNSIYQNGEDGIYLGGTCWESYIQGNSISYNGKHGLELVGAGESSIIGNDFFNNDDRGIYGYASTTLDISNNEFGDNGNDGVLLQNSAPGRSVVADNRFYNNDALEGGYAGLTLSSCNETTVTGNYASTWAAKTQDYGLREAGTSNYNVFVGNIGYGSVVGIVKLGANSVFEHNINGTV